MQEHAATSRAQVLERLARHCEQIRSFGVVSLGLFGSTARDALSPESDVDLVVTFEGKATIDAYMDLKFLLEDILGRKVDLVTSNALRPALKARLLPDLVDVA